MTVNIIQIILLLFTLVFIISSILFSRKFKRDGKFLITHARIRDIVITEQMLADLPLPVQRYLRFSGVIGKPWINTIHLKQAGRMKSGPQGIWFPLIAEEYFSVNPSHFIWHAWIPGMRIPVVQGSDEYHKGVGQFLIKLLSIFTVVNARGKDIDHGEMIRYLNEMMWFPTAFLGDSISWKAFDDHSAEVTLTENGKSVNGIMHFDTQGKLISFIADRYYGDKDNSSLEKWEVPVTSYEEIAGYNLPKKVAAVWKLQSGDFRYIDVTLSHIEFNVKE